jgi:hypothetical protein
MTTGSDYYLNSLRLLGFCGVDGINWAVVTRMKEIGNPSRESFHGVFPFPWTVNMVTLGRAASVLEAIND